MADWTDKDELANYIRNQYDYAGDRLAVAQGNWSDAWWEMYREHNYDRAQQLQLDCLSALIQTLNPLISYAGAYWPRCAVPYFLWHHTDVTWRTICEAWVADDFEGMEWTIACIDRMRTLMWDRPFNIRWAASPTQSEAE